MKYVKRNTIFFKLFWYKVFVDWKLKLLNFLVVSILSIFRLVKTSLKIRLESEFPSISVLLFFSWFLLFVQPYYSLTVQMNKRHVSEGNWMEGWKLLLTRERYHQQIEIYFFKLFLKQNNIHLQYMLWRLWINLGFRETTHPPLP